MRTATRCTLTTRLPARAFSFTNLVEEEQSTPAPVQEGSIHLDFRPFEIKTVRLHL